MTTGRTVLKNFLSLTAGNTAARLAGLAAVIYLARILGPADFGKINFAFSIIGYFALLSHFGLNTVGTREIAQNSLKINYYVNNVLSLKILLGFLSLAALTLFALLMPKPEDIRLLVLFYGVTIFTTNVLPFDWVVQGYERMEHQAAAAVLQAAAYLSLLFLFVKDKGDLLIIPWVLFTAQTVSVIYLLAAYRTISGKQSLKLDLSMARALFRQALPIGLSGLATVVVLNAGITLLGFMKPQSEVGLFAAAHKIAWVFVEIMIAYVVAVFPAIAREYTQKSGRLERLFDMSFRLAAGILVPAAFGALVVGKNLTQAVYGKEFEGASAILGAMMFYPLLVFANNMFFHSLWAAHRQKVVFVIGTIQALLTVALCVLLIPGYGAMGAAAAMLGAGLTAAALYHLQVRRVLGLVLKPYFLLRTIAAASLMSAGLMLAGDLSVWISIPLGIALYIPAAALFGVVGKRDLELIRSMAQTGEGAEK